MKFDINRAEAVLFATALEVCAEAAMVLRGRVIQAAQEEMNPPDAQRPVAAGAEEAAPTPEAG